MIIILSCCQDFDALRHEKELIMREIGQIIFMEGYYYHYIKVTVSLQLFTCISFVIDIINIILTIVIKTFSSMKRC